MHVECTTEHPSKITISCQGVVTPISTILMIETGVGVQLHIEPHSHDRYLPLENVVCDLVYNAEFEKTDLIVMNGWKTKDVPEILQASLALP